jgi:hypothetical protein
MCRHVGLRRAGGLSACGGKTGENAASREVPIHQTQNQGKLLNLHKSNAIDATLSENDVSFVVGHHVPHHPAA